MNTVESLRARRAELVRQRQEVINLGHAPVGVDIAITAVDRQLQALLGDEDEEGSSEGVAWGDVLCIVGGVMLLIGAAVMLWVR